MTTRTPMRSTESPTQRTAIKRADNPMSVSQIRSSQTRKESV